MINCICADNPHKDQDELRKQLAQSSAFNYAQHFFKGDNLLHAFTPDIFIDPAHFKQVSASDYRVKRLMDGAKDAIEDRYQREKLKLKANFKIRSQNRKKLKTELDARRKYENKHPLGIKQLRKPIAVASQYQVVQQAQPRQANKKSSISSQKIQRLHEYNNNQVAKINRNAEGRSNSEARSTVSCNQDSSCRQVMNQRSKAFESSIAITVPTTEYIKINSQTVAFLQSQNIDATQFAQIEGLPIQHQLTHELVDILDAVADYAQQHDYEIYQTHLTKHCAHLALLFQKSNGDGTQRWALVCNNIIKNGGINDMPKEYNPISGLSRLTYIKK